MIALMHCYHSIASSTCKDDISVNAICHLRGSISLIVVLVGLHRFPLVALVAYPVILRSTLLHRGYSQRLGGN